MKNKTLKAVLLMTPYLIFKGIFYTLGSLLITLFLFLVSALFYFHVLDYGIYTVLSFIGFTILGFILLFVAIIIGAIFSHAVYLAYEDGKELWRYRK